MITPEGGYCRIFTSKTFNEVKVKLNVGGVEYAFLMNAQEFESLLQTKGAVIAKVTTTN